MVFWPLSTCLSENGRKLRPLVLSEVRSGRDACRKRTGHAGAAQAAIARRVLGEVLLVIVFGEIERPGRRDFGRDGAKPLGRQRLLVSGFRGGRGLTLRVVRRIDR